LADFFNRLIASANDAEILYDDIFCETFQSWLVAASSSKLRAFRHTSTVIVLLLVESLCSVADEINKDFNTLQRQKEAETRKAASTNNATSRRNGTTTNDKSKLQDLTQRLKNQHSKKTKLETYFKDLFDGVFVHRYRDSDTHIRMECIRALGRWMNTLPDYWLEGNYLRYIGWMLTDLVSIIYF